MPKKKRIRIQALSSFSNVIDDPSRFKGTWNERVFQNDHPITLEVGCGKGEYSLALARRFPERNFIGIDLKGARLFIAAQNALDLQADNIVFVRIHAEKIADVFSKNEVEEIWIPFPDPYPKKARKRLTSTKYIQLYRQILKSDAGIHLKTDDEQLFRFTIETCKHENCIIHEMIPDLYQQGLSDELLHIQTTYEKRHLDEGKKIKYVWFSV
ncbi:MAG: tRNA (guanosine(46)-N7)-methyltransferase TrmB [Calditrichaeota bacterium]|nr:tRNA (guanosine(46)-N7)-methyltransferase TrmB [Calditrichota bacterium]